MCDADSIASGQDDDSQDNGLRLERPEEWPVTLENVLDYEKGGHHPVHLGDILNQHYKVIHKLGSGDSANVWLCRDTTAPETKYVAVKINMADRFMTIWTERWLLKLVEEKLEREEAEKYFRLPRDQFTIDGPNGKHYAFVYTLLGPDVAKLANRKYIEDREEVLRKVCFRVAQAMDTLHGAGICHGDFRPANIFLRLSGFDRLSEEQVLEILGSPETDKVLQRSGGPHNTPTAPQYLVHPINWNSLKNSILTGLDSGHFITDSVCVINFDEAFEASRPPKDDDALGTPHRFHPPEYVLEKQFGYNTDNWALGCTLFEIRCGKRLFDPKWNESLDDQLYDMVELLGILPEPWWSTTWQNRSKFYEDEADANGRAVPKQKAGGEASTSEYRPRRSLQGEIFDQFYRRNGYDELPDPEIFAFADLLVKCLRLDLNERATARDVLEHEWFKMFGGMHLADVAQP